MRLKKVSFFVVLLLLTLSSGARAQFLWKISHIDADFRYTYTFTSISSSGSNCSATCSWYDRLKRIYTNVVFTSNDGGVHWEIQDPGLPWRTVTDEPLLTAIQQIDSLNIVASGDSGVVVRTFDGGITWENQTLPTVSRIISIHFSDPMVGVAVAYTKVLGKSIYTTDDGGKKWTAINYTIGLNLTRCHSYGNGKFSIFQSGRGQIITTKDNWKTKKIISNFVDSTADSLWQYYQFTDCNFTGGDTICVLGGHGFHGTYGAIIRSIDGGIHWEKAYTYGNTFRIVGMTSLDRDTVIAGGDGGLANIHFSSDRGKTWRVDTIVIDTAYPLNGCRGLCWISGNKLCGIFSAGGFTFEATPSLILRGGLAFSNVRKDVNQLGNNSIYPNPATTIVTVISEHHTGTIHIIDIIGREVLQGICTSENGIRFDTRKLHKGLYSVYSDSEGHVSVLGKLLIMEGN